MVAVYLYSITAMTLLRCNEFDNAMEFWVSISIYKRGQPLPGFLLTAESPVGIIRPVLNGA